MLETGRLLDDGNPVQLLYRQDLAFGPERFDYAQWIATLAFPFHEWLDDWLIEIDTPEDVVDRLEAGNRSMRESGVCGLRSVVYSHIQPNDDRAIMSVQRIRLLQDGGVHSHRNGVWVMVRSGGVWRAHEFHWQDAREPVPIGARLHAAPALEQTTLEFALEAHRTTRPPTPGGGMDQ